MLNEFVSFVNQNDLFKRKDSILLAVSGGIDSVVMCDLFHSAGYNFGIAHCNFKLRTTESDEDELFVKKLADKYKVRFFTKSFDTRNVAAEKGISIQMAARDHRYQWFVMICDKMGFDYIATAHHQDDQIETFFINLTRQTGIAGLHGILPKKNKIIRPLLFAGRKEIALYTKLHKIAYREDSSNKETKYLRNKIRHEIIPVFLQINPEFSTILNGNIQRFREAEMIYRDAVENARKKLIHKRKNQHTIPIDKLKELKPVTTFAFELLNPYGFTHTLVNEIIEALDSDPGLTWFSPTHRLIKDRQNFIITELTSGEVHQDHQITLDLNKLKTPIRLTINKIAKDKQFLIDESPDTAQLDLHKLKFPLTLRKWKTGDVFHPYGSNHKKKISDFFTDHKLSLADKEEVWLLCSGDKIAWIIGYRIDHHFRIKSTTKEVYMIKYKS